jgi:hypothetical protein
LAEPPQPAYREMTNPANRNILSTITPKLWAAFQRSYARAIEYDIPEKVEMLERSILQTAGIEGRAREDLRDALRGAQPASFALSAGAPMPAVDGRPRL